MNLALLMATQRGIIVNNMDKLGILLNNGLIILGKKIDSLAKDLKNQKVPIIKVPDIAVPEAKVTVEIPEIKIPEIVMPAYPKFPDYPAFPEVKLPPITVNVPEIKLPTINVPETVVNVPAANITVEPTPVEFPSEMKVTGIAELITAVNDIPEPAKLLEGVSNKNPIPVQMVDSKGRPFTASDFGGEGGPSTVAIRVGSQAVGDDNLLPVTTDGFSIPVFDTQVIDESAAPATTTITYSRAGSTVAIKTITVSGTTTTISVVIS